MSKWTTRIGDQLLAAVAPRADAAAATCYNRQRPDVGPGCFQRCCSSGGSISCGPIACPG